MRRRCFGILLLTLLLASPLRSDAQQQGQQLHDPNEYSEEDSHPVRIFAYLLSPVGVALEYGITRPLHYLATNTPLSAVLDPGKDEDTWSEYYENAGPIGAVPLAQSEPVPSNPEIQPGFHEQNLGPRYSAPSRSAGSSPGTGTGQQHTSANPGQPILQH